MVGTQVFIAWDSITWLHAVDGVVAEHHPGQSLVVRPVVNTQAAADVEHLPSHPGVLVGGQERDRLRDIGRRTQPTQICLAQSGRYRLLRELALDSIGEHDAASDTVGPDAESDEFPCRATKTGKRTVESTRRLRHRRGAAFGLHWTTVTKHQGSVRAKRRRCSDRFSRY
jgi:hypothetical protein